VPNSVQTYRAVVDLSLFPRKHDRNHKMLVSDEEKRSAIKCDDERCRSLQSQHHCMLLR